MPSNLQSDLTSLPPTEKSHMLSALNASALRHALPYPVAAVAVGLSMLVSVLLMPWLLTASTSPFTAAIVFSAWYGGFGPAVFCAALAALARLYLSLHYDVFPLSLDDGIQMGLFLGLGLLVASLFEERHAIARKFYDRGEWLRVTLASIGDAVIATDCEGKITFMNAVAETLTGWGSGEAVGLPMPQVFRIVNEYSGAPAENPVDRVLREGQVVGLANHTALVARDGTQRPIEDSAAPIHESDGRIIGVVLVFRDVAEQQRTRAALDASEARFRVAQELSLDAFTILHSIRDGSGAIIDFEWTYANPAAIKILGRGDITGKRLLELLPGHRDASALFESYVKVVQTGQPHDMELHYDADNIRGWFRNMAVKLGDGVAVAFTDITERHDAEQELKRRNEQLAAASRAKDEFLAVVSHELRTPLTSMMGWIKMVRSGKLDRANYERGLEIIERNTAAQARLIEDLLDVSRIISGKLLLDMRSVELAPVAEAAIETVHPAAMAKGVEIAWECDGGSEVVRGDPNRLQQIIYNLVSNAIKFTPKSGHVAVRLTRAGTSAQITVTDTGIGIDRDFLPYLFERFRQADSSITRQYQGLGLGLAIVRHLVELHGGTIYADSDGPGQGATFNVRLPIAVLCSEESREEPQPGGLNAATEPPESEQAAWLAGLRVLVVEDEPDSRELLVAMLQQYGAQAEAAGSASEALQLLDEVKPDLLLSDIGLPGEDGYSLLRRVRARRPDRGGRIPAIALTAYAKTEDRIRALQAGFQTHVTKPVEPDELAAVIASVAGIRRIEHVRDEAVN